MSDGSVRKRGVSGDHALPECDARMAMLVERVDKHSERLRAVDERLQKGEVLFTKIEKDMERLTDEVKGIKTVLMWIGGIVGTGVLGLAGSALVWAIRAMPLLAVWLGLVGCTTTREERKEVTRAAETVVVQPVQIDTPVGQITVGPIQAQRQETREHRAEARAETTVPAAQAVAGAAFGGVGGGGVVGLASGAVGVLAGAVAWWRKRQADLALRQTVEGIEEAKTRLPPDAVNALLDELRKSMDEATKERIRKARAEV